MSFRQLVDEPLWRLFRYFGAAELPSWVAEEDRTHWYSELAVQIAKNGKHGLDFLLGQLPTVDNPRVRAILTALCFLNRRLLGSPQSRKRIRDCLHSLLDHHDPLVVADAVDALNALGMQEELETVRRLANHSSPYVVGSVLRFMSRHSPEQARPMLEQALQSSDPIIRQNGVDELDELNSIESLPKLRDLVNDPDAHVREAAKTAVTNLEQFQREMQRA